MVRSPDTYSADVNKLAVDGPVKIVPVHCECRFRRIGLAPPAER